MKLFETILGTWVSSKKRKITGKCMRNGCQEEEKSNESRGKTGLTERSRKAIRAEIYQPFERKYTGTPRTEQTERTAGMCFCRENELMCTETTPEKENMTQTFVEG